MQYIMLYVAAIIAANLVATRFGPAITPLVGFFLIGLNLVLRDRLHDRWAGRNLWPRMLGLIAGAGAVSYLVSPATGPIALASVAAFCLASLADAGAYHTLIRHPWAWRVNGSNVAGSAVDSIIFPLIAFGAFMPEIVVGQFVAKIAGGVLWSWMLMRRASSSKQ